MQGPSLVVLQLHPWYCGSYPEIARAFCHLESRPHAFWVENRNRSTGLNVPSQGKLHPKLEPPRVREAQTYVSDLTLQFWRHASEARDLVVKVELIYKGLRSSHSKLELHHITTQHFTTNTTINLALQLSKHQSNTI